VPFCGSVSTINAASAFDGLSCASLNWKSDAVNALGTPWLVNTDDASAKGASLTGLTVIATCLLSVALALSRTVTVSVSLPL
jgi:hypothetical protein